MAAVAMDTARARSQSDAVSAILLVSGAAALSVGTLFYAQLSPVLGLPAPPAARAQALADALSLGPAKMALAGGFAFLGDVACCSPPASPWLQGAAVRPTTSNALAGLSSRSASRSP
jgi:hypothetical protein